MKFRKKPVVIEAHCWLPDETASRLPEWMTDAFIARTVLVNDDDTLSIETLEGVMRANAGDWVIKGVKDELYPCRADIFAATYEAA